MNHYFNTVQCVGHHRFHFVKDKMTVTNLQAHNNLPTMNATITNKNSERYVRQLRMPVRNKMENNGKIMLSRICSRGLEKLLLSKINCSEKMFFNITNQIINFSF